MNYEEARAILCANVKLLRKARGISQERLGYDAGIDRTMVSKIERKLANPTLEVLVKLANCLDVKVTSLLDPTIHDS
jgi:transcriptional regulator with XRE-family HTH domain